MNSGYFAAATFLLCTGIGACAQVHKLRSRGRAWERHEISQSQVFDGLNPVREFWSFSAFTLFALSGLTRSYTDYFLLVSRLPVIALATVILWYLRAHRAPRARELFLAAMVANTILIAVMVCTLLGAPINTAWMPTAVDLCLSVVSVLLFHGKMVQVQLMYRHRKSQAVSWLRELGLIAKDLSGLWYAIVIGPQLFLVGLTHALATVGSVSIIAMKVFLEYGAEARALKERQP